MKITKKDREFLERLKSVRRYGKLNDDEVKMLFQIEDDKNLILASTIKFHYICERLMWCGIDINRRIRKIVNNENDFKIVWHVDHFCGD